jgi:phosphoesterase RecJ-like protein
MTLVLPLSGRIRDAQNNRQTHRIRSYPVEIYTEVYDKSKIGKLKLLAKFLESVKLAYDNKLAYAHIYVRDFETTGTNVFDTEGFSHHLMSIDPVQISVIFTEVKTGIKLSFRSKGEVYVNEFAKEFGGGGHKNAAGAFITSSKMEDLTGQVIQKAKDFIV